MDYAEPVAVKAPVLFLGFNIHPVFFSIAINYIAAEYQWIEVIKTHEEAGVRHSRY
jgi:hypothetical protein